MKESPTIHDEELVAQAKTGSEAHFNALVDRYTPAVYRVALGITGNHHEAEDLVQETFVKVFHYLDRYSPSKGGFKTWVLTIARNQSINVFKSIKRRTARLISGYDTVEQSFESVGSFSASEDHDAEQILSIKQEIANTRAAVKRLPERQRTALMLKSQEGLSYEEIAVIMNTSVSSVESLIFRARKRLLEIWRTKRSFFARFPRDKGICMWSEDP